jgi:hypothetical protein
MNRRSFLKWLGVGTAVAAVAPTLLSMDVPAAVATPAAYSTYVMGKEATIGSYADYVSFSNFAISAAIDEAVSNAAEELSHHAMSYRFTYDSVRV